MEGVDVQALNEQNAVMRARYPQVYRFEDLIRDPQLEATFRRHMQESEDWRRGNVAYQRLLSVLRALRDAHGTGAPAVLYIHHLHRLLGSGGDDYPFDLASVLKPLLHRFQIQLWGACTLAEYRTTIEHDGSMQRCFQEISLPSIHAS